MYEKEERMLKGYFQDAKASAAGISDEALDAAIREGIRKGSRSKRSSLIRHRGMALLAGALAVVVLLVWGGPLPQTKMATGPYPPLTGHAFGEDITLTTANKHGLIQPVGKSATQGDYTITVDGVLAGSQQLKVLYTLENRSDRKVVVRNTKLTDPVTGEDLPVGSSYGGSNEYDPGVHPLESDYIFQDHAVMPTELSAEFLVARDSANARAGIETEGEEMLSVDITLDMETYRKYIRTIPIHETIEVQGQEMLLREAVLSPAGITLKGNVEAGNTMKVSGLWDVYLDSVKEGKSTRLTSSVSWGPGDDGNVTYFFSSNSLDQPDSLILKAGGMYAVDPAKMSIVVDTEKGVVLSAPIPNMKVGEYAKEKKGHTLTLEYEVKTNTGSVSIDEEFTDGKGNKHQFDESSRGVKATATSNTETGRMKNTSYLYLLPKDYPQPLTFKLTSSPGVIKKVIEVPIISNGRDIDALKSSVLDTIPKPEDAKQAGIMTNSNNPNIIIGVRYERENIGGEQGLYPPEDYFQQLKAAGWSEIEDERMGHVHFFEKDEHVIAIEVREDALEISEMQKNPASGD